MLNSDILGNRILKNITMFVIAVYTGTVNVHYTYFSQDSVIVVYTGAVNA